MKRAVLAWMSLLATTPACTESRRTFELPPFEPGTMAIVVIRGEDITRAAVLEPSTRTDLEPVAQGDVFVFYYVKEDFPEFVPGPLLINEGERAEAIPRSFVRAFRGVLDDGDVRDLEEATTQLADGEEVDALRVFPVVEAPACLARSGCFDGDIPHRRCRIPCTLTPAVVEPPQSPVPCSDDAVVHGWTKAFDEALGVEVCSPPSLPLDVDCGIGETQFPFEAVCSPIGDACSEMEWPADLPESNVLYVRAGSMGAGTRQDPLPTLASALAVAMSGDTIALAAGDHEVEGVTTVREAVHIRGVCARETRLQARAPIIVAADGVTIENLAVRTSTHTFFVQGMDVKFFGMCFVAEDGFGVIVAPAASATIARSFFEFTQSSNESAIFVAGEATLESVRIEGPMQLGILSEVASRIHARNVGIRDVDGFGLLGYGELDAAGIDVRNVAGVGISIQRGHATIADVHFTGVRNFQRASLRGTAAGLVFASPGTEGDVTRAVFKDNAVAPMYATNEPVLTMTDVFVREIRQLPRDCWSIQTNHASLALRHVSVETGDCGDFSIGPESTVSLTDVVTRGLRGGFEPVIDVFGPGGDAHVTIDRLLITERGSAVVKLDENQCSTVRDLDIAHLGPTSNAGDTDAAVIIDGDCRSHLERVRIRDVLGPAGLRVQARTMATTIRDLSIDGVVASSRLAGGIKVPTRAGIDLSHFAISAVDGVGIGLEPVLSIREGERSIRDGSIRSTPLGYSVGESDLEELSSRVVITDVETPVEGYGE